MRRLSLRKGWFALLPFLLIAVAPLASLAQAEPIPGLDVTVYDNSGYESSPPLPAVSGKPVHCTLTYSNINQDFGNSICGLSDHYIVKYEGYITSPVTQTITFHPQADDGTKLYIDDVLIDDNWVDKGGGGNLSSPVSFTEGIPKPITLWFYENGGGNWVELHWNLNGSYEIVPVEAFTKNNETSYTIAPYLNPVTNLTAVANADGSVDLAWDAPTSSNTDIYAYSVSFYDLDEIGGTTSGGWGVWTNQGTNYSLSTGMFSGSNPVTTGYGPVRFGIKAGNQSCFSNAGVGPCVYGPEVTVDETVIDPTPPATTTTVPTTTTSSTTTTTTTTSTTVPTTIYVPVPETTVPEPEPTPTTLPEEEEDLPEYEEETEPTTTTIPPQEFDEEEEQDQPTDTTQPQEIEEIEDLPSQEIVAPDDEENQEIDDQSQDSATEEDIQDLLDNISNGEVSIEDIADLLDDISDEQLAEVLDSLSEEESVDLVDEIDSPEGLVAIATALVDSEEPIAPAVAAAIILNENFNSVSAEDAAAVFANIDTGAFSDKQKSDISAALTEAPTEIKKAFEEEINIYGEGFDDYVPTGSEVDVGARRTLIAAATVLSTVAVAGATGGASGGSGGPSRGGGSSGSPTGGSSGSGGSTTGSGTNDAARREEELEEEGEEAGGIEGPEDEEDIYLTKNSIFNYYNEGGMEMKKMNWFGLGKKVWQITAGLAFTLAGSFVMFVTLSGETRKMAIIATMVALTVHYVHEILKNDEE